jgi:hypothetical protein
LRGFFIGDEKSLKFPLAGFNFIDSRHYEVEVAGLMGLQQQPLLPAAFTNETNSRQCLTVQTLLYNAPYG